MKKQKITKSMKPEDGPRVYVVTGNGYPTKAFWSREEAVKMMEEKTSKPLKGGADVKWEVAWLIVK